MKYRLTEKFTNLYDANTVIPSVSAFAWPCVLFVLPLFFSCSYYDHMWINIDLGPLTSWDFPPKGCCWKYRYRSFLNISWCLHVFHNFNVQLKVWTTCFMLRFGSVVYIWMKLQEIIFFGKVYTVEYVFKTWGNHGKTLPC